MVEQNFKHTEVGFIPEDWEVKELHKFATLINGRAYALHEWEKSGVPVIRLQNLTGSGENYYYSNLLLPEKNYCYKNDLLFMWSASFGPYLWKGDRAIFHYHIWKVDIKPHVGNKDYLYQLLSDITLRLKSGSSNGGTMLHLTKGNMDQLLLKVPPLPEQRAIATALSDADSWIESLVKLLAKKRLIKQGAMKRLLTPGEDWEVRKLGEVGFLYGGLSAKTKQDFGEGNCFYVPFVNVMRNTVIDSTSLEKVRLKDGEKQNLVLKNDLLFNGSSETPEELGLCAVVKHSTPNLYLNSFCFGLRLKSNSQIDSLFLAYFFRTSVGRDLIFSLAQGSTRYNLSKANFLLLDLRLPPLKEQTRIATILSDMDAEIESLEKKLQKARQIKQGMMQVLLTGKVRLVGKEEMAAERV